MKRSKSIHISLICKDLEEIGLKKEISDVTNMHDVFISSTPSGFTELDKITGGWQPGSLVIIGARPSMGKTAFMLSMVRNMAVKHRYGVAFSTLELSAHQLVKRMIVSEAEVDWGKTSVGKFEPDKLERIEAESKKLCEAPIFIDDTPALTVSDFRDKCLQLVLHHKIRIAFIDYLQLMTWTGDTKGDREQELSNILRSLKAIAKELNITIIALSQLNRPVENRTGLQGRRPRLADFREAPAFEQDADMVVFIYRPEEYGFTEDEEGNSLKGIAEIIVAKNRHGKLGDARLTFKKDFGKFVETDKE